MSKVRFVGLDVHKDSIVIAYADEGRRQAKQFGEILNDWKRLQKALRQLGRDADRLHVCYEAGPTGFTLCRRLREIGIECDVVAPSLIPSKAGERVKTDRRDARKLAHFLRSGDLTPVYVPDEAVEALRDLERARHAAKRAERTARHQLTKFLLRYDRRYDGPGRTWSARHLDWIRAQRFAHEAQNRVLRDYLKAVEDQTERVDRLTKDLEELVEQTALAPLVRALQAFRGIRLVTAVIIAAELGDLRRFATARQLMAYLGLVPSEESTGTRRRQGRITRAGNSHVRWILVEAAWHYCRPPLMSKALRRRNQGVAEGVRAIAWKAQKRLNNRYYQLARKGKNPQKAVVAVARELAGFLWAVGQQTQLLAP